MAEYYKMIKGKKHDRELLALADASTKGRGDGRISMADARRILAKVRDSGSYTGIEKRTMSHIRDHYKFTPEADEWFRQEVRRWAASKRPAAGRKKTAPAKRAARKVPAPVIDDVPEEPAPLMPSRPVTPPAKKSSLAWKLLLIASAIIIVIAAFMKIPQLQRFIPGWFPVKSDKTPVPDAATPRDTGGTAEEKTAPVLPEKKPATEKEPAPPPEEGSFYVVEPKDSLVGIAEKLTGDYRNWVKLYQANRGIIKSPILIFTGQKLVIPEELRAKKK